MLNWSVVDLKKNIHPFFLPVLINIKMFELFVQNECCFLWHEFRSNPCHNRLFFPFKDVLNLPHDNSFPNFGTKTSTLTTTSYKRFWHLTSDIQHLQTNNYHFNFKRRQRIFDHWWKYLDSRMIIEAFCVTCNIWLNLRLEDWLLKP